MDNEQLKEMRLNITALIDDVKYQSDSLTDLERLPVIQLKVILAKINKLTEKTTILLHYIEKQGKLSDKIFEDEILGEIEPEVKVQKEEIIEEEKEIKDQTKKEGNSNPSNSENIEDKLKKILVTDLISAIGINEKYLFASVLFKGSIENFTMAVQEINVMSDINIMKSYLEKLEKEYKWDLENETVQNFIELMVRKFD